MRRELGLDMGSELGAQVEGGRVVVEDRLANLRRWRDAWRAVLGHRSLADELVAERRAEASLEEAEASGDPDATAPAPGALRRAAGG
ncbi:MAG TPA: hypothetical protein VNN74_01205 [Candidatus Micrarchaeia archaeon]|nr:hypothetical protein [Candidatus Micrarchaeia archaeon]